MHQGNGNGTDQVAFFQLHELRRTLVVVHVGVVGEYAFTVNGGLDKDYYEFEVGLIVSGYGRKQKQTRD
jgi:hypothetical protein